MRDLPFTIDILGDPIHVRYWKEGDPPLGGIDEPLACFDERDGTVIIRQGEEGPGLRILIAHEFMHIIETLLIQQGILEQRVPHDYITHGAAGIILLMAEAGMLDIPKEDVREFFRASDEENAE